MNGGGKRQTQPSIADLTALEAEVNAALEARDESLLPIIGRGEISIALGWPAADPQYVCKRTPPFTPAEFSRYQSLVNEYVHKLRASGQAVVDTQVVSIESGDNVVGYVVQPMLDAATLGHNVLNAATPNPDHPFLAAVADAAASTTSTCSIDAQVTNFAWDGKELTLVDVGTPFLWTASGDLRFEMKPFADMIPALTRGYVIRELTKVIARWNDPRVVAVDVVANLLREGLCEWIDPMLIAVNRRLDLDDPITLAEAQAHYKEDQKTFPTLVRLQRVERWWQEKIRRQTYDWFIWSTFDN